MPDDSFGTFIKDINNNDAGQLASLIANFSGTLGAGAAVLSLFQESDTDKILGAINQLREDLARDFGQLGDLIKQQIQLVVDITDRDAMALALSRSDAAADRIQDFLVNNEAEALGTAKTESIAGVSFFFELGLTSPDLPFFLPGILKAGAIRLLVISAEPANLHEPAAVVISDVGQMIDSLSSMIDRIRRTVNRHHYVKTFQHSIACPPLQELTIGNRIVNVIDGYAHYERAEPNDVQLQFFDAQRGWNASCEHPSPYEEEALSAAVQALYQGISDELEFLDVPGFEEILQSWRDLL